MDAVVWGVASVPSGETAVRRMVKRLYPMSEPEPVAVGGERRNRRDSRTRLGEKHHPGVGRAEGEEGKSMLRSLTG